MAELIPLAVAAAFWPVLLAVVLVALQAPHPGRLLVCFLAGGLLATITVGLVIVYALDGSALVTSGRSSTDPVVNIVLGVAALILAYVLMRRYKPPDPDAPKKEPSKTSQKMQAMLERGAVWAFVAGILVDLLPSPFALVALKDLSEADYSIATTFLYLLGFYLIVFMLIEVPLIGYAAAPESTADRTVRFNAWFGRNWYRLAIYAAEIAGVYLIVKGIYQLFT